jgi:myo-inositol 2-dehydrogenase/D-chiro-inositol 1-dehydrogenase
MNFLILGDGPEEHAWAQAIALHPAHHLLAAYPGFDEFPDTARPDDFDAALALAQIDAVVVGGTHESRCESLRRVAAAGFPSICLHPPGDDSEAYYQVALSDRETGAIVIPDLPARLHPALAALKRAIEEPDSALGVGAFRGLRIEWSAAPGSGDLARVVFACLVDTVRALIGDVEAVTATGDPPGPRPTESLIVHLRGHGARRAEVRIESGPPAPGRILLTGASGTLLLEHPATWEGNATLVRRTTTPSAPEDRIESAPWDRHEAILAVLAAATAPACRDQEVHPNLIDGTRAMEVSEAAVRSLRRGRTVDLHYETISEMGTFKSVMTSIGCVVFLSVIVLLPIALMGPPLGIPGTIYIGYAIPPLLFVFIVLQLLRFAVRSARGDD